MLGTVGLLNLSGFNVERNQVYNLRAAENNRLSAALFVAFYQEKLADCNVCSRLLNLVFVWTEATEARVNRPILPIPRRF